MPPKPVLFDRALSILVQRPFVCTSCRSKRAVSLQRVQRPTQLHSTTRRRLPHSNIRHASTISSVTTVNAKPEIPPAFQDLHRSLSALEHEAAVYVNVSQLRLAFKGLESENAVTRVAVLGLNGQQGARRLTRALLADPLVSEPEWERILTEADERDGKAWVLRYGEQTDIDDRHPLVKTLVVPSSLLYTHNLEIFIQATKASEISSNEGAGSLLVPGLEMVSSAGRLSTVTYPVHKTLVCAEGLEDWSSFSTMSGWKGEEEAQMLIGVVDGLQSTSEAEGSVRPLNLKLGEHGIGIFRKSLEKSVEYEHEWFASGMPSISTWLNEGTDAQATIIKPSVRRLVGIVCNTVEDAIQTEEHATLQQQKDATVSTSTREIIDQLISLWAEKAHNELRDRLDSAFVSKTWKKSSWWKLFWRADDVGYVTSNILENGWLVQAEREMIWICGLISQSGLLGTPMLQKLPPKIPEQQLGGEPSLPRFSVIEREATPFEEYQIPGEPFPRDILQVRNTLSKITIPPLQALSQILLLQTISTNVLTSSVSALLCVSLSTTSLYEAGSIAALGLVWSLRRLQKRWEGAREEWKERVREDGRRVLQRVEENARETVREGGRSQVDEAGVEEREVAREAVGRVREALGRTRS